jgi:ATP-dependent Zn protease
MGMKQQKNKVCESTAYHEAGHAVAHIFLHLPFKKVSIRPDGETSGHCMSNGQRYLKGVDYDLTPAKQDRIFRNVQTMFAGHYAQKRFNRKSVRRWHSQTDYHNAVGLLFYISEPPAINRLIRWLECRTQMLIETRWQQIETVARALLERETLTSDEVRELIFGREFMEAAK